MSAQGSLIHVRSKGWLGSIPRTVWGCVAADQSVWPCWLLSPLKAPATSTRASEPDHGAMEEGGLVRWIMWMSRMHYGEKISRWRLCDDLGNVRLGNLGPGIHSDVTLWRTIYLNVTADQVHHFVATLSPNSSGFFQLDNAPWDTPNIVREWFEKHKSPWRSLDLQISQILIRSSICEMCWTNKSDPWRLRVLSLIQKFYFVLLW